MAHSTPISKNPKMVTLPPVAMLDPLSQTAEFSCLSFSWSWARRFMEAQGVSRRLPAGFGQLQYKLNRFANTSSASRTICSSPSQVADRSPDGCMRRCRARMFWYRWIDQRTEPQYATRRCDRQRAKQRGFDRSCTSCRRPLTFERAELRSSEAR